MMNKLLDDPELFFHELGGMHDAKILAVIFNFPERSLTISVDDINAGFCGMPEYLGKRKASIIFGEVENVKLTCDANSSDIQRIYDFDLRKDADSRRLTITLTIAPGGRLSFICGLVEVCGGALSDPSNGHELMPS